MATLSRFCSRALLCRNFTKNPTAIRIARISTTKKDKDTTVITPQLIKDDLPEKFDARVTNKIWVSWGWDWHDREKDATFIHLLFFVYVTLVIVGGTYYVTYSPKNDLRDWAQREAYLEIKRREELGLPYIDRDVVPIDPATLPTDEELGDREIII